MFSSGPKYQKLKTNLQLVVNRLKLLEKKKTELAVKSRKEIADFLQIGKEERARIRVEHIIREDYLVEGMEVIEMYCDLLLARLGLIQTQKELDPGLEEPVASIIWATPRLQSEVAELKVVSEQLTAKYGKEFAQRCKTNELNNVNEKLMHKISVQAPPRMLVDKYLEEIAKSFNVPFIPELSSEDAVLAAEGLLIDFNGQRNGGGGGGGGGSGGGGGMMQPMGPSHIPPNPNIGFAYPQPQPGMPVSPLAGGAHAPPFTMPQQPPAPGYNSLYTNSKPVPPPQPSAPSNEIPDLPELPTVPANTLPGIEASAGGEDVDFDDLTRRFEELKKKK